ncbi:uncharacterized protein LACBIDRAFT_313242 [Laccaria bicolor S238N-H82]|uniref:Predicted protein n=1 Tax=Laccaria bicolor (strain S238N-H82 / ATCC MYA-4686) TaxID=486041 RepID=B0DXV5_LACBS|nr:uncharacterized protein LACBIDRAFT_313242 [Laccaria bicolor S238N-H82]EDR00578.1 predicted protein [Laccaria bicolor S238N-H82]|eukprot:XP_001888805.1 predicted protein [Laccaria bicolor S238N-H82]
MLTLAYIDYPQKIVLMVTTIGATPSEFDLHAPQSVDERCIKIFFYPPRSGPSFPDVMFVQLPPGNQFSIRQIAALSPRVYAGGWYEWLAVILPTVGWWAPFDDLGYEVIDDQNIIAIRDVTPPSERSLMSYMNLGEDVVTNEIFQSIVCK